METFFLKKEDLFRLYARVAEEFLLYVPARIKAPFKIKCEYSFSLPTDEFVLKKYFDLNNEEIVFNEYRCIEPTRSLFAHFKEDLGGYFAAEALTEKKDRPVAISGIKNCDLFSLKIQDFVFLGGAEPDPVYKKNRQNALIISGDCPSFKESCFCRAFDINPHVTEGFDFNLSIMNNGYLLDVATPKAENIARSIKEILTPITLGQSSGRAEKRQAVIERMHKHLALHKIPKKETLQDIVISGYKSLVWTEEMRTCVECGGCVFMCDTCHCFLLADEPHRDNAKRTRIWDGCLFKNFSKVAGGANPLRMRYMRLRNRYLKKFDFFIETIGFQACCGCGRCIDACPGRIDIRRILRRLYEEKYLSAH